MEKWRETSYRITKFNPENRNSKGGYLVDEWTSFSDSGKDFNGIRFTYEDYILTEDKYILSILEFCNFYGIKEFDIVNPELNEPETWDKHSLHLKETFETIIGKKTILSADTGNLARLILREYFWCDLKNYEKGIHFGYDYYMYFDTGSEMPEELKIKIQNIGLYIE